MGQDATATLSEIQAARQRLQRDIEVLQERLERGGALRQQAAAVGAAAAAAAVCLIVVAGVTRRRLRARADRRHAGAQAALLADALQARGLQLPARSPSHPQRFVRDRSAGHGNARRRSGL